MNKHIKKYIWNAGYHSAHIIHYAKTIHQNIESKTSFILHYAKDLIIPDYIKKPTLKWYINNMTRDVDKMTISESFKLGYRFGIDSIERSSDEF